MPGDCELINCRNKQSTWSALIREPAVALAPVIVPLIRFTLGVPVIYDDVAGIPSPTIGVCMQRELGVIIYYIYQP